MSAELEELRLCAPAQELGEEFLAMLEEFARHDAGRYLSQFATASRDVGACVQTLLGHARGLGLPPGFVPEVTFWLLRGKNCLLGSSRLRLGLTRLLTIEGGHIGYDIRPTERGKGYGTRLLALTLQEARQRGMRRVLVTCDADNLASAGVIEKNGGVRENQVRSPMSGKLVSRYWIDIP
jgi:predicted acetyltransferase